MRCCQRIDGVSRSSARGVGLHGADVGPGLAPVVERHKQPHPADGRHNQDDVHDADQVHDPRLVLARSLRRVDLEELGRQTRADARVTAPARLRQLPGVHRRHRVARREDVVHAVARGAVRHRGVPALERQAVEALHVGTHHVRCELVLRGDAPCRVALGAGLRHVFQRHARLGQASPRKWCARRDNRCRRARPGPLR